jgi:hypothetical protein
MNENEMELALNGTESRPWWSVRAALLAALTLLVCVLIALLAKPELLDRGFRLAGL